jgi:hypothetical protein
MLHLLPRLTAHPHSLLPMPPESGSKTSGSSISDRFPFNLSF